MTTHPLVYVRKAHVITVPPVCTAHWSPEDWAKVTRLVIEPLAIEALGETWRATGERDERGALLYARG